MGFFAALLSALLGLVPGVSAPGAGAVAAPGEIVIPLAPSAARPARDADAATLPPIAGSADPSRPLVVIDAGHGGQDPGAISPHGGTEEKRVTLALARAIRDALAASGRVRVAMTRDDDVYLDLRERYGIARRMKADLFVSVHADAAPANDAARGATIYTLSEVASDREAALLAARENRSQLIGGGDSGERDPGVERILIDLAQRESMAVSTEFAQLLKREGSEFFPFRPDWHRFASLIVLKAPDVPSVLLESGYMTNQEDSAYIQSEEGRAQIATGVRRAVEAHFARRIVAGAARRGDGG